MGIEFSVEEAREFLASIGIVLSDQIIGGILFFITLLFIVGVIKLSIDITIGIFNAIKQIVNYFRQDKEINDFIRVRNRFSKHLTIEIERINQETDWNDFYYTDLEAEVEVDSIADVERRRQTFISAWIRSIPTLIKSILGVSSTGQLADSLLEAISKSYSRVFLVIGDPGSGKTISLRTLSLRLAEECSQSKNKHSVVPLYLNLKGLNIPPDQITADAIHEWSLVQLQAGQDRLIYDFLEKYFDIMLDSGQFFFLFDSFDEIPAVMDAQEDAEIVQAYATALSRFLHAPHDCRGLVTSRPYRAPKNFLGQRISIKPLNNKRIKFALQRYLANMGQLAETTWYSLVRERDDLLRIASNPFYLGLLARFTSENQQLPQKQYDLFEHFVQSRVRTDENRLRSFNLSPEDVTFRASSLAYLMIQTSNIGLEASISQIHSMTRNDSNQDYWDKQNILQLLSALTYSKIGRLSQERGEEAGIFSFVHRRFHEYFCARYLLENLHIAPISQIAADDRWREVLVLLCEVMPNDRLSLVFEIAEKHLYEGIEAKSGTLEHIRAIETLRFLKYGFRGRIEDVSQDICKLCSQFIDFQFEKGHDLDRKRALEGIAIADKDSAVFLIEKAMKSKSKWLTENTILACRHVKHITPSIAQKFREYLFTKYADNILYKDYGFYDILLSTKSMSPLRVFLKLLMVGIVVQLIINFGFIVFLLTNKVFRLVIWISICLITFNASWYILRHIFLWGYPVEKQNSEDIDEYSNIIRGFMLKMKLVSNSNTNKNNFTDNIFYHAVNNYWNYLAITLTYPLLIIDSIDKSYNPSSLPIPSVISVSMLVMIVDIIINTIIIFLIFNYPEEISLPVIITFIIFTFKRFFRKKFILNILITFLYASCFFVSIRIFSQQDFSLYNMILRYTLPVTVLLILPLLPIVIGLTLMTLAGLGVFILIVVFIIPKVVIPMIRATKNLISDQSRFIIISIDTESRPKTTLEAINILNSFKSQAVKGQYVRTLSRWFDLDPDWQVLINAANNETGYVRETLFKLAESWEDSIKKR